MSETPLLDIINLPRDIKKLKLEDLERLAQDVRLDIIDSISQTGGHLGASLGTVELTVALYHCFDPPHDKILWDIGHQAYAHKILTQRRLRMKTLRQRGGISGFLKRSESLFDVMGAGHASTSISTALGMAIARDLKGEDEKVICIIGDGAMSAGMAFEALNNLGATQTPMLVILNDNDMSIAKPVGAMSSYLTRLSAGPMYQKLRARFKYIFNYFPEKVKEGAKLFERYALDMKERGGLFEDLGLTYFGPIDGHNIQQLLHIFKGVKDFNKPVLLHIITKKGYGYAPAEEALDKYHGIPAFDRQTGVLKKSASSKPAYTDIAARSLVACAKKDERIVAITAAMPSGTGLGIFRDNFPKRFFDVGIAEQHAVTFAAGLAMNNLKPFVALYSTFLQRAYDQIVHDVCLQRLPVRFLIDRAGVVGADGPTHDGLFDILLLACLPDFLLMAPSNADDLENMIGLMNQFNEGPSAVRYPKEQARSLRELNVDLDLVEEGLCLGKSRTLIRGKKLALISLGTILDHVCEAHKKIEACLGFTPTLVDARFAKPLDEEKLLALFEEGHTIFMTIEEGVCGGFGAHVSHVLAQKIPRAHVICACLPDHSLQQDTSRSNIHKFQTVLNANDLFEMASHALSSCSVCD